SGGPVRPRVISTGFGDRWRSDRLAGGHWAGRAGHATGGPSHAPPLASMVTPVIQRASGEARKATTSATSEASPIRPSAVVATIAGRMSGLTSIHEPMSVSMTPGVTVLTV